MNLSAENNKVAKCVGRSSTGGRMQHKLILQLNKENIDQQQSNSSSTSTSKMPSAEIRGRMFTASPTSLCSRARKHSDASYDHALKHVGLQEIESNNKISASRRQSHSSSDVNESKPFGKSRFAVYNDTQSTGLDIKKGKGSNYKSLKNEKSDKLTGLCESIKDDFSVLKVQNNNLESKPKISPPDLHPILKPDVNKIKEIHKNVKENKIPKNRYDIMSMDLAYNIEYMTEYVRFQMEINDRKRLTLTFLKKSVTPDQRRLIVKYLMKATSYYQYPSFILYQAVKIFDFYIDLVEVKTLELQPLAVAALWIALKKDLMTDDIPDASEIVRLAQSVFQKDKKILIEYEKKILMSLKFEISFAEPFSMLALYTVMIKQVRILESVAIEELYYCGSYLIDISLLHDKLHNLTAVHLAAISAEIALVLVMSTNIEDLSWSHWRNQVFTANPILEKYRLPDSEMDEIRAQLLQKVILSEQSETDFHAVYKKYSSKRYGPVSKLILSRVSVLYIQKICNKYAGKPICF